MQKVNKIMLSADLFEKVIKSPICHNLCFEYNGLPIIICKNVVFKDNTIYASGKIAEALVNVLIETLK